MPYGNYRKTNVIINIFAREVVAELETKKSWWKWWH